MLPFEINNFFYFRGSWNGVSRCASCCLIDLQHLQYYISMFICLSWIVPFILFNIDVAIITQQYLSFQRILKRSAFASHSFCIENIVGLIILDLPIKLPKAGKVYLSIFFNTCVSTWTLNNISADLELECVAVSSILPPVDLRTATMLLQISLWLFCHKIAGHYMCKTFIL